MTYPTSGTDNKTSINPSPRHRRDKRMEQDVRTRTGSTVNRVWMEVLNPSESSQGKYTLEMFDGSETHRRHLDLSGPGGWRAAAGVTGGRAEEGGMI